MSESESKKENLDIFEKTFFEVIEALKEKFVVERNSDEKDSDIFYLYPKSNSKRNSSRYIIIYYNRHRQVYIHFFQNEDKKLIPKNIVMFNTLSELHLLKHLDLLLLFDNIPYFLRDSAEESFKRKGENDEILRQRIMKLLIDERIKI